MDSSLPESSGSLCSLCLSCSCRKASWRREEMVVVHKEQAVWSLRTSGTSLQDRGRGCSSHEEGLDYLRLGSISPLHILGLYAVCKSKYLFHNLKSLVLELGWDQFLRQKWIEFWLASRYTILIMYANPSSCLWNVAIPRHYVWVLRSVGIFLGVYLSWDCPLNVSFVIIFLYIQIS